MRRLTCLVLLLAVLFLSGSIMGSPRRLVLLVEAAPSAWGNSRLTDQLVQALSRESGLRIVTPGNSVEDPPPVPGERFNIDSLLDWGTEIGGRYLLVVSVAREALERRKTFNLPLFFQRWKTVGIIEGEIRLLDLQKKRLLAAESFSEKLSGSGQYQGSMDNNRNDPSLHLPAPEKSRFFQSLEAKLVKHLVKKVKHLTRGR